MPSKHIIVKNPDNVILIVLVPIIEHFQNFEFYACLMLKPLLIPDHFNSHKLLEFMIEALNSLAEAT